MTDVAVPAGVGRRRLLMTLAPSPYGERARCALDAQAIASDEERWRLSHAQLAAV